MTEAQAKRAVKIAKYMGDDRYSWALFVHGKPVMTGMDQNEARWRRTNKIKELTTR